MVLSNLFTNPSPTKEHNSPMWYSGPEGLDNADFTNEILGSEFTRGTPSQTSALTAARPFDSEDWTFPTERDISPFAFVPPEAEANDMGGLFMSTQDYNHPTLSWGDGETAQQESEVPEVPSPEGAQEAASGSTPSTEAAAKENASSTTTARRSKGAPRTRVQPTRTRKAPAYGPVLIAAGSSSAAPTRPRARRSRANPRVTANAVAGPSHQAAGPSTTPASSSTPKASGSGQAAPNRRKRGRDESDDAHPFAARGRERRRNPGEINQYLARDPQDTECKFPGCEEVVNGRDRKVLIKHLKTHYAAGAMSDPSRHYPCAWGNCGKEITGTIMVDHVRSVHLGMQWVCPVGCGWDTGDYTHVNTHMKRSHPTVVWPPPKPDAP